MKKILLILSAFVLSATVGTAKVKLHVLMSDNMVLQQQAKASVWGWADAGKTVTVTTSWDDKSYTTKAAADGSWLVKVATPEAGGPYTLKISDGEPVTLSNVMIGEVWVCSGQSNMEMGVQGNTGQPVANSLETILGASKYRDRIHMFTMPRNPSPEPQENFNGEAKWNVSEPAAVAPVSAAAYFFARYITDVLGVPVGIIATSYGGTPIEAWMDEAALTSIEGVTMADMQKRYTEHRSPCGLYNGMIWPLRNYTARGFLWYQGEANRNAYQIYAQEMAAMVQLWRQAWGNDKMPFYYVQIAPYFYDKKDDFTLGYLVEAQYNALSLIPYSGMAATSDIGDEFCIHPPKKDVVGQRLALQALVKTYGVKGLSVQGPVYKSVEFQGGTAKVTFTGASRALSPQNQPVLGFELAGADRKFYPAEARIVNGQHVVQLTSKSVPKPVAVRYCFRNYMEANLTDTFGLAAYPFRTDNWEK